MRRFERWLFTPGDPRRLAAVRIGLCAILAARMSRGVYVGLAGQPAELFRPVSFMHLFPSMPGRGLTLIVQIVGVAAAILACSGLRPRVSLPLAWACAIFLNGMATSLGKVVHNDVILLLAMVPLLPVDTGAAWSIDAAIRRERPTPRASVAYGWPVRTATIVAAGAYFFTGLSKLVFSGPAWVTSDNLRFALYASSDNQAIPNTFGLLVADRPWLAHLVAASALGLELGFPLVLWRPRLAWLFVPGAVLLHGAIWLAMHLNYVPWIGTVVVVFVDWPAMAHGLRGRGTRRARAPATGGLGGTL